MRQQQEEQQHPRIHPGGHHRGARELRTVTVAKGGSVVWTNDDSVNHDVTKTSGPGPDFKSGTGNLAGGDTYKQTFDTPGTIVYRCTIHPGMDGKIIVK